ncbi:hypothetical protein O181_017469 [Austropuccinia psidii MF-1]|uniref:Deoxyhypusine hydroxylase n=1 Tax=Austropuccinia psidii MF-1 TaxID=1389203 RepID=A0A9Q3C5S7_9BASI|nr:hypothetical protein [Austropuccinia psidii MF-1]
MTVPTASQAQIDELHSTLSDDSGNVPLASRFRALFTLRALGSPSAVKAIGDALRPIESARPFPQALLGHELAYCLGQIGDSAALPVLEATLRDRNVHPMVRHEAAEAMGAIGDLTSLPVLKEFLQDPEAAVRETCELAIAKIQQNDGAESRTGEYGTVDPTPSMIQSMHDTEGPIGLPQVEKMRTQLLDPQKSLFERYRAMFGLRDAVGRAAGIEPQLGEEAIQALAAGFFDKSALFRHEVAYVFGQLSHPASVPALLAVLENKQEDEMVRHEAAEALGSIATPEVLKALQTYASAEETSRVVRESCVVALDMYDYEHSQDFQYTLPLNTPNELKA